MSNSQDKQKQALTKALLAIKELRARLEAAESKRSEPVAVVGMACRFPGNVASPEDLDTLLRNGIDAITEIPKERWDLESLYDPTPQTPGKMYVTKGGFLKEIDEFDAHFFGISPREARAMDPQQRIMMEVTWEALENAGIPAQRLAGSQSGVYVGMISDEYAAFQFGSDHLETLDPYCGTGTYPSVLGGRLSYFLDLKGPSYTLDTACSTSLAAIHLACRDLGSGTCDLALAGGINLFLKPNAFIYYSQLQALAPDGRCKAFDDGANGFVKSEGCGMLVLKRLKDAVAQGDEVLAVIRGSAANHDGRSSGLAAPNGTAQEAVIRQALDAAGVQGADIGYVEAHGTGTSLGDPIEVEALLEVLGQNRSPDKPLYLGSAKTNLGHTEAAAGVAGVIKAILALRGKTFFPHLHFKKLNPQIETGQVNLCINTELETWNSEGTRYAGVSAFGISGTNVHLVLEEPPSPPQSQNRHTGPVLLPISARDPEALQAAATNWLAWLNSPTGQKLSLGDVGYSAALCRDHHHHRLTIAGVNREQICLGLKAFLSGEATPTLSQGRMKPDMRIKPVFVFPGQGSQWVGMGRRLMREEPVFAEKIKCCDELVRRFGGWSLLEELAADEATSRITETAVAQPAIFAMQVALSELWKAKGVSPAAVIGHSMGEVAAAHVAGVLSLCDAVRIICRRSILVKKISGLGAMAMVELSMDDARAAIEGLEDRLDVAANNGPTTTLLSGNPDALNQVLEQLTQQEVFARPIKVDYASHSPQIDAICDELQELVAKTAPQQARVPLYSTVTGQILNGPEMDARYWVRNIREPVLFCQMARRLIEDGMTAFIEISPHPVLTISLAEIVREAQSPALVQPSLRRQMNESAMITAALGALYCAGFPLDWKRLYPAGGEHVQLPNYPWQRRRYWVAEEAHGGKSATTGPRAIRVEDLANEPELARKLSPLMQKFGFASQSVGEATGKPYLFIDATQTAMIFFNRHNTSLVAMSYTGPRECYAPLIAAFLAFAKSYGLSPAILDEMGSFSQELNALGFSTTCVGAWQQVNDIQSFTLAGNKMRRLRYHANRYEALGDCRVVSYDFADPENQCATIIQIIDAWAEQKAHTVQLLGKIKQAFLTKTAFPESRTFLVLRDDEIDGVIMLSPMPSQNGFLLDMEFYRSDTPQGCMEFGITRIINMLAEEGYNSFSLGITLGTLFEPQAEEDPEVVSFFADLHQQEILNGDSNCQFKNKFRPTNSPTLLAIPSGAELSLLTDFLIMLGDPLNQSDHTSFEADFFKEQRPTTEETTPTEMFQTPAERQHPLVHQQLDLAIDDQIFRTVLSAGDLPYLDHHAVKGTTLVSSSVFLEMARAALKDNGASLAGIIFREALVLEANQAVEIQIVVQTRQGDVPSFKILSRSDAQSSWRYHAGGEGVKSGSQDSRRRRPPEDIEVSENLDHGQIYELFQKAGYDYGASFRCLQKIGFGEAGALGELRPAGGLRGEGFQLHPAMLDACLQVSLAAVLQKDDWSQFYLPFGIDHISFFKSSADLLFSSAYIRQEGNDGTLVCDVLVYDSAGEMVADCQGIVFQRVDAASLCQSEQDPLERMFHNISWRPGQREQGRRNGEGHLAVFCAAGGVSERLARHIRNMDFPVSIARHGTVYCEMEEGLWELNLHAPEDAARFLDSHRTKKDLRLVDLTSLDALPSEENQPLERLLHFSDVALTLVQALHNNDQESQARIWFVTAGAMAPEAGAGTPRPCSAGAWGLGRVLARENPDIWGGLIDLGGLNDMNPADAAELLISEIVDPDDERFLAYQGNRRYVARLEPQKLKANTSLQLHNEGTYLITGGLGALGLEVAAYFAQCGAGTLALLGRRPPDGPQLEKIAALEQAGTRVLVLQGDVSDTDVMAEHINLIERDHPRLRGVIHAAGLLRDGILVRQTRDQFAEVMNPKVKGAWNLHQLTQLLDLDFLVLFSSVTSLLGTPGQANYAAANAYMDALAGYRRQAGLPCTSINWGRWEEAGLAQEMDQRERTRLDAVGIKSFSIEAGMRALERALANDIPQTGVFGLDRQMLTSSEIGSWPLCRDLVANSAGGTPSDETQTDNAKQLTRAELMEAPLDQRYELFSGYLRERLAAALGREPESLLLDGHLYQLGLDSLMIMELRNRLKVDLGIDISAVKFFQSASAEKLVELVMDKLSEDEEVVVATPTTAAEPVINVEDMSDDEVEALLLQMSGEELDEAW